MSNNDQQENIYSGRKVRECPICDKPIGGPWKPEAMFRYPFHATQYCQDLHDQDEKYAYQVVKRSGWFIVEKAERHKVIESE